MSERKIVYEKLFERDGYSDDKPIPEFLVEFVAWVQAHLGNVPSEYRDKARIDIKSESDYDGGGLCVSIYYPRPETDAEMAQRESRITAHKVENMRCQRIEYDRLKVLFEG